MAQNTQIRNIIDEKVVNNLVRRAQRARNESVRARAIDELWACCGNYVTNIAVGKSYRLDPDFSLHGMAPKERQEELSIEMFLRFRDCVMDFDSALGVPFLAWVAKKIKWQLLDDKRANSKRGKREKVLDGEMCAGSNIKTGISGEDRGFVQDCENRRLIDRCRNIVKGQAPKLLRAFDAMDEDSKANDRYCDSRVAKALGCSKVYVGILRKEIRNLLIDCGMEWAPDGVKPAATDDYCLCLPGCSPYTYKDKAE